MDELQFKARIEQIHSDLDQYSYYELLNLSPGASPDEIRASFHRMALSMHPDRFLMHEDTNLRQKVHAVYMRITEAYRVLMSSKTRKTYDQGLPSGRLRLTQVERKSQSLKREEDTITNAQAKKFFLLAQAAERQGNFKSARMNLNFALNQEPKNQLIQEHLSRLDQHEKEQQKSSDKDKDKDKK